MGMGRIFGAALGHGGPGYIYHVESISSQSRNNAVSISWTDPCDDQWVGTKIVRKTGSYPQGLSDGTLVVDSRIRNQYAEEAYFDTDVANGTVYYYMAFPYSYEGINFSASNRAQPVKPDRVLVFSGTHTSEEIMKDGKKHQLLCITGSGMLTVDGTITADICLVGGGANGMAYGGNIMDPAPNGGAGGYLQNVYGIPLASGAVTIGAANGGTTTYDTYSAAGATKYNGGTGGGRGGYGGTDGTGSASPVSVGDGLSKVPFGLVDFFFPHCGAGGGGCQYYNTSYYNAGYHGGTNGGNSGSRATSYNGGNGGNRGGGKGCGYNSNPTAATFYGSGGGGAGGGNGYMYSKTGGAGYQGVMYILVSVV